MMIDELRRAAETLRRSKYHIDTQAPQLASVNASRAMQMLADAWLAENDPTELTEEWLSSVGFKHDDERPYHWINSTFTKFDLVAWDDGDWELADANNSIPLVPMITTRGAVRLLCRALGIDLNSP